ncbi:MAG: type IV pilus twitching motility protein PilT [Lachnospirales bacterium]
MEIFEILTRAKEKSASDIHLTVGLPAMVRNSLGINPLDDIVLVQEDIECIIEKLLKREQLEIFKKNGEVDLSFGMTNLGRYRMNAFKQSGRYAVAIRAITEEPMTIEELGLPPVFKALAKKRRGLILVTGPTGSGKSTTLAAMIDYINTNYDGHIVTIEDPIEYTHRHKKSIVNQREIGFDTRSFSSALRAALRQDPDVILVGEMRDLETIQIAISAAETGHLVLSTLHTIGAAKTIDRIIDVFPTGQQPQVRSQLSGVLQAVISQQLLPRVDKVGRVAAFEIMTNTVAIGNLIREGKIHQINSSIQTGKQFGMQLMDKDLLELFKSGIIDLNTMVKYAVDPEQIYKDVGMEV